MKKVSEQVRLHMAKKSAEIPVKRKARRIRNRLKTLAEKHDS